MKIKVAIKRPGEIGAHSTWIENNLENLQKTVGGYIETVTIAEDVVVICNEEGRIMGLPHNCKICGVDFVGTIIIAGVKGDDFADIPCDWEQFKKVFANLWEE